MNNYFDLHRLSISPTTIIPAISTHFTKEELAEIPSKDLQFLQSATDIQIRKYKAAKVSRQKKEIKKIKWDTYVKTGNVEAVSEKVLNQHSKVFSNEELPPGFFKTIELDFFEADLSITHEQYLKKFQNSENSNRYSKLTKRYFKLRTSPPAGFPITPITVNKYGYLGLRNEPASTQKWAAYFFNKYLTRRLQQYNEGNLIIQPFIATFHILNLDKNGGGHLFLQETTKRIVPNTLLRNLSNDVRFAKLFVLTTKEGNMKFEDDLVTPKTKPSSFFPYYIKDESRLLSLLLMATEVGKSSPENKEGENAFLKKVDKQILIEQFNANPTTQDLYVIFYYGKSGHIVKSAFPIIHMFEFNDSLVENTFSLPIIGGEGVISLKVRNRNFFTRKMFISEEFSYYNISDDFLNGVSHGIYVKVRNTHTIS